MNYYKKLIIHTLLLVLSISAQAQIVNVENKRTHQQDTSGVFGNVDLGVNLVENGSTILTLRSGAQVEWLKGKNLWLSSTNFNLVRVQEDRFVNNGFQHLRYNYNFNKRWTYEAFGQLQFNEKTRIKLRALAGTGGRLTLANKDKSKAFWGMAYMFEFNEISDTNIINRDHRLSTYLSFNWQPLNNLTFSGTSYYQPILNDFGNGRLSSLLMLQLNITDKLSFKTTFQITYDGQLKRDAPGVPATTYSLINGLRWDF
jgi:putative salt-induced outer membrane protein YdiY